MSSLKNKPQTLKGFRDFLPEEMRIRNAVVTKIKEVFESFGFEPLETPSLEYADTLLGKYGEEADRLVYKFKDRGGREVAMPYDLTVPTAKLLAIYQNKINFPFKRYQIQRVWRAEKPQKGRLREFLQCDVDIFGSMSPLADAEIIIITAVSLQKLGFKDFYIKLNNRQILFDLLKQINITKEEETLSVIRIIDKLEKKPKVEVEKELIQKKLEKEKVEKLFEIINAASPNQSLTEIFSACEAAGIEKKFLRFDPTLARGLDYYSGPIFEAVVEKPKIGSIAGGGRYDFLIKKLGGPDIPATGISFGIERICEALIENKLIETAKTKTKVLVTIFSPETLGESISLASKLRSSGICTDLYPDPEAKLDKQLKYADRKGIPYCAILGPEEIAAGKVTLKNMKTGEQKSLPVGEITKELKNGGTKELKN
ncbi:MAG: histidine--tRNA ligase [Candidatus Cloacimonetes bacterium]|nr:histidine--tRNA ligase [Candidatus Cloacimonadota bacterium]